MAISYTPQIYRSLGAKVSIDLGQLADIGVVKTGVSALTTTAGEIKSAVAGTALESKAVTRHDTETQHITDVGAATVATINDATKHRFEEQEKAAAERQKAVLDAIAKIGPSPQQYPELNDRSAEAILCLLAIQTAILASKGKCDDNLANQAAEKLRPLRDGQKLVSKLNAAMARQGTGWAARSACFWALHDLIEDVAACAKD